MAAPYNDYLCLNTELLQDDYVTAIEFYMAIEGDVNLKVGVAFPSGSFTWFLKWFNQVFSLDR